MYNNVHTQKLGAPNGLNRYLHGASEALVDPRFQELMEGWHANWSNETWFAARFWANRDRWVRFHYLPRSRERPTSARDDREIVRRYTAILSALVEDDASFAVVVETYSWQKSAPRRPEPLEPGLRRILANAVPVGVRRDLEESELEWAHLWVSDHQLDDPAIRSLFDSVTAQHERPLFVIGNSARLFKPYTGGVDVLLESTEQRDALAAQFSDWLSPRLEWIPMDDEQEL